MNGNCREDCKRYNPPKGKRGSYIDGQKRCKVCECFIVWEGANCPCCHSRLRCGARRSKNRIKGQSYSRM